jgi:hypothetical protein
MVCVEKNPAAIDAAKTAAMGALSDADPRVRREAIAIVAKTDTEKSIELTARAFAGRDFASEHDRKVWADHIAEQDALFEKYLEKETPGGTALLIEVGKLRRDPRLAAKLLQKLPEAAPAGAPNKRGDTQDAYIDALLNQRDPAVADQLYAQRQSLSAHLREYLPLIFEYTFEAARGRVMSDWDAFFAARK